jgi:hypothetical protein
MKHRLTRILPLILIMSILAAIPASTQVLGGARDADEDGVNLPMVILINRLELTSDQMQSLKETIDGLLVERSRVDQALVDFEQEMIAFAGTSDELDARLEEFRAERVQSADAFRDKVTVAIDEFKNTLSMKQGEILREAFPGLTHRAASVDSASGIRERIVERLGTEFPAMMNQIRDRFAGRVSTDSSQTGSGRAAMRDRVLGRSGAAAGADKAPCAGSFAMMRGGRGMPGRAGSPLDWLEQFSQALGLKLQNVQS